MKRILLVAIAALALTSIADAKPRVGGSVSFGLFYSSLAPHGEWIECDYGYVWRPIRVPYGWRPYMHGRWVWTDYGWYWYSYEPYGWAVFHYGRWYYDDYYGWIWVPDDVWGPAWVEWRYDNDYIGWAPLTPYARFGFSIGITYSTGWYAPVHYWNFVTCRNFTAVRVSDYVQPVERVRRIYGHTRGTVDIRTDGDRVVNRGIDINFVERRGKVNVDRVDIMHRERGDGDRIVRSDGRERLEVYRPNLEKESRSSDVRPPNVRRAERPITFDADRQARNRREGGWKQPEQRRPEYQPERKRIERPRRDGDERMRRQQNYDTHKRESFNGGTRQEQERSRRQESVSRERATQQKYRESERRSPSNERKQSAPKQEQRSRVRKP